MLTAQMKDLVATPFGCVAIVIGRLATTKVCQTITTDEPAFYSMTSACG